MIPKSFTGKILLVTGRTFGVVPPYWDHYLYGEKASLELKPLRLMSL
jgi:hypothetical protein